jgi:hypothetical protein
MRKGSQRKQKQRKNVKYLHTSMVIIYKSFPFPLYPLNTPEKKKKDTIETMTEDWYNTRTRVLPFLPKIDSEGREGTLELRTPPDGALEPQQGEPAMNVIPTAEKSPQRRFRITASRILLTYSRVAEEMRHEDVSQSLNNVIDFQSYVIGEERHKDGGKHFHVILIAKRKFDIRTPDRLDLCFKGKVSRGN